jgi:hypothetical protein
MDKLTERLAEMVVNWWDIHQYDTVNNYNIYDDEPDFVVLAKKIRRERA